MQGLSSTVILGQGLSGTLQVPCSDLPTHQLLWHWMLKAHSCSLLQRIGLSHCVQEWVCSLGRGGGEPVADDDMSTQSPTPSPPHGTNPWGNSRPRAPWAHPCWVPSVGPSLLFPNEHLKPGAPESLLIRNLTLKWWLKASSGVLDSLPRSGGSLKFYFGFRNFHSYM